MSARCTASMPTCAASARRPSDRGAACRARADLRRRSARDARRVRRADGCWRCLIAPLVGSTHDSPVARVRPLDSVRRQRRRAGVLRRAPAARARGGARRRAACAVAGVVFQALLRNPLASPDTLGVSAGATLGAMLAITFHLDVDAVRRVGGAARELRRLGRRARRSSTRWRSRGAAARRARCCCSPASR